jgi:hypothetical protein
MYVTDAFLYEDVTHDRQKLYHEDMRRILLDKKAVIMTIIKHAPLRKSNVNQNDRKCGEVEVAWSEYAIRARHSSEVPRTMINGRTSSHAG